MSNNIIFFTQIVSIVIFVLALFGLYRLLIAQKDGVIELLRQRNQSLQDKISDLESQSPDALVTALSARVEVAIKEIGRLKEEGDKHKEEIIEKESDLQKVQKRLTELTAMIQETDLVCPHCDAPLVVKEYHPVSGIIGGREIDADTEYIEYECGLVLRDGREDSPCKSYPSASTKS